MERRPEADSQDDPAAHAEERFAAFVAAFHEALLQGEPPDDAESQLGDLDPASQDELRLARRVLAGLDRAKRVVGASHAGDNASAREPGSWAEFQPAGSEGTAGRALRRLGRFAIERELGRGGLGIVFLAYDPVLRRRVALKVPRPEALLTTEVRKRFEREAQAAARLTHPNLIPVYEVGQAGPVSYIASGVCDGPNLATWLRERKQVVDPRMAAEIVRQLADAVHYAHAQGVLHRDLKPSNVLLEPREPTTATQETSSDVAHLTFTPKLADFGLARVADTQDDATGTGLVLGTPGYMSPEQAQGRTQEIGPRTDVYGLGALLYELLVGKAPFAGHSNVETLTRIVTEEPRPCRSISPNVPHDLDAICLKCLEKRPAARYGSAADLAADLQRFLEGQPTVAHPIGPVGKTWRWMKRRPYAAALLCVLAFATAALTTMGWLYASTLSRSLAREQELVEDLTTKQRELRRLALPGAMRQAHLMLSEEGALDRAEALLAELRPAVVESGHQFPWDYLRALAKRRPMVLPGHVDEVYAVAFSPDGTTLATSSKDKTVRIWDVATKAPRAVLEEHAAEVNSVCYSVDGRWLYSADDAGEVRLWDASTGKSLGVAAQLGGRAWHLVASEDGTGLYGIVDLNSTRQPLVSWKMGQDGRLSDMHVGEERRTDAFVLLGDKGLLLVDAFRDRATRLLSTSDRRQIPLPGLEHAVQLAKHPQADIVAVGTKIGQIGLVDTAEGVARGSWPGHTSNVEALAYTDRGAVLISAARDGLIRLWCTETHRLLDTLSPGAGRLWSLAVSPDGRWLAAAGATQGPILWDLDRPENRLWRQWSLEFPEGNLTSVQLSQDTKQLVLAQSDGNVTIRHTASGAERLRFRPSEAQLICATLSSDNTLLELQVAGGQRHVHNLALPDFPRHSSRQLDSDRKIGENRGECCLLPHNRALVNSLDKQLVVVDLTSGKRVCDCPRPESPIREILAASHAPLVALIDANNRAALRSTQSLESLGTFPLPENSYLNRLSPDGSCLASARERIVELRSLPGGKLTSTLAFDSIVVAVAFSPTNDLLAVALDDSSIRLLDRVTREELPRMRSRLHTLYALLAFNPDGQGLVDVRYDPAGIRVRSWQVPD